MVASGVVAFYNHSFGFAFGGVVGDFCLFPRFDIEGDALAVVTVEGFDHDRVAADIGDRIRQIIQVIYHRTARYWHSAIAQNLFRAFFIASQLDAQNPGILAQSSLDALAVNAITELH